MMVLIMEASSVARYPLYPNAGILQRTQAGATRGARAAPPAPRTPVASVLRACHPALGFRAVVEDAHLPQINLPLLESAATLGCLPVRETCRPVGRPGRQSSPPFFRRRSLLA